MPQLPAALRGPRHRARRQLLSSGLASVLTAGLVLGAASVLVPTVGAHAAGTSTNPFTGVHGFTVAVAGNAALGTAGEIEGSVAAGGDVSFQNYNLASPSDGSALPAVDGPSVQLFVGGTVLPPSSGKLDVNAGYAKVSDTSGMVIKEGVRLSRDGVGGYLLKQNAPGAQNTISNPASASYSAASYTATAGAFAAAFPTSTFADLAATSSALAALTSGDDVHLVTSPAAASEITVALQAGKVNIWNIPSNYFAGINAVNFGGVTPSATTPLVINVDDATGTALTTARFNGAPNSSPHFANFVLWNFAGWSTLTLAAGGSEMAGAVLAPEAHVTFARTVLFEGQIVAGSLAITGSAEIHHWGFTPELPSGDPVPVAGSWQFDELDCSDGTNSLVVHAVTGITYTWTAGGTGSFTSFSSDDLPAGTYAFTVAADTGYTLDGEPSFSHAFPATPTGCADPEDATGAFSFGAVTCETPDSASFTLEPAVNASYAVSDGVTTTSYDPATTTIYPATVGSTYTITVVPDAGHALSDGTLVTDSKTFAAPTGCDVTVTVSSAPSASPESCVEGSLTGEKRPGSITIVHVAGVVFAIDSVAIVTGAVGAVGYPYPAGDYLVTASAKSGYTLSGASSWPLTVGETELPCSFETLPTVPTGASSADQSCDAEGLVAGSITVEPFEGVSYFIDGVAVTRVTTAVEPGLRVVTAIAADGLEIENGLDRWEFDVAEADEALCDDLETLALTGSAGTAWAAALAVAAALLGAALLVAVLVRRRALESEARQRGR